MRRPEPISAATAREALRRLDGLLADNSETLRGTISNLNTFTGALAKNSDRIDGIVAGLERMTGGGDSNKAQAVTFDLTPAHAFPSFEKAAKGPLAVAEPMTLIVFDTQKLVLRSASGSRTQMAGNVQWADTLPKLIQSKIVQSFENALSPTAVGRAADNFSADRQLLIDVRNFELMTSEQPTAMVELAAKIVGEGNRVLDARTFSATAPATSTDAAAGAAALDRAFGKVATEIVIWTQGVQ